MPLEGRLAYRLVVEPHVVELGRGTKILAMHLIKEKRHRVASIWVMGGLGQDVLTLRAFPARGPRGGQEGVWGKNSFPTVEASPGTMVGPSKTGWPELQPGLARADVVVTPMLQCPPTIMCHVSCPALSDHNFWTNPTTANISVIRK
ncbi:unnamed protein product [Prunus armeniaca]